MKSPFHNHSFFGTTNSNNKNRSKCSPASSSTLPATSSQQSTESVDRSRSSRAHTIFTIPLTSTLSLFEMGQTHGKFDRDEPLPPIPSFPTPSSSPGSSDPFYRPKPPVVVLPEYYRAPHSAPVISTTSRRSTSATTTTTTNGTKGLIRSLSQKQRRRDTTPVQSVKVPPHPNTGASKMTGGHTDLKESIKAFEAMVVKAEQKAGIISSSSSPSISSSSTSDKSSSVSKPRTSTIPPEPVAKSQVITPLSATPPHLRSLPRRRASTSSLHSTSRGSVISAERAEREWRAKVVAISSGFAKSMSMSNDSSLDLSPASVPVPHRSGPVPPKRHRANRPIHQLANSSTSTLSPTTRSHDSIIITPPSSSFSNEVEEGVQARRIANRKSFETLGHHARLISDAPSALTTNTIGRTRKPSVPRSAISSFFYPGTGIGADEGTRTRTNSLAASMVFESIPPNGDGVTEVEMEPTMSPLEATFFTARKVRLISSVDSMRISPTKTASPRLTSATQESQAAKSAVAHDMIRGEEGEGEVASAAEMERNEGGMALKGTNVSVEDWSKGQQRLKVNNTADFLSSTPSHKQPNSSIMAETAISGCQRPSPDTAMTSSVKRQADVIKVSPISTLDPNPPIPPPLSPSLASSPPIEPTLKTPTRLTHGVSTPSTPYSPTTAYILSAPTIDDLTRTLFDGEAPSTPVKGESAKHPFASFGVQASPEPPMPSSKELATRAEDVTVRHSDGSQTISTKVDPSPGETKYASYLPQFTSIAKSRSASQLKKKKPFPNNSSSSSSSHLLPSVLKTRPTNIPFHYVHSNTINKKIKAVGGKSAKVDLVGKGGERPRSPGLKRLQAREGVDLTPGQEEGGLRPPKSGLPRNELERWLIQSATTVV
ncbi:hypothetical protein CI109_103353 [Kwoniella shandongensis]|uniref:Uncharacterized protein n=1 Tax=Kwoniella shandongensis TaxID=1734106 RepID=A0A5M6BWQ7_9TREE|nr:uncharacterized protein CI109_004434 [Kwoniella shandongensis]KAA5527143.1 hypothetical protein CI109_004434 [Kwoniella shandongensis]